MKIYNLLQKDLFFTELNVLLNLFKRALLIIKSYFQNLTLEDSYK